MAGELKKLIRCTIPVPTLQSAWLLFQLSLAHALDYGVRVLTPDAGRPLGNILAEASANVTAVIAGGGVVADLSVANCIQ
eukprot:6958295-Lingulodinium_polyedra.AAC.1